MRDPSPAGGIEADVGATQDADQEAPRVPREPLGRLFLRFVRFGSLAWGGPVAQIAMIRAELVDEERWVSRDHFNRALAVPGASRPRGP